MASKNGYVALAEYLLEKGKAEVNRTDLLGYTALMHASKEGHLDLVKLLLEKGHADPTISSNHVRSFL